MARRRVCVAALILAAAAAELKGPHAGGVADRANRGESYCHPSRAGLRCQGHGLDKRCWMRESCKPDPGAMVQKTLTLTLTRTVQKVQNYEHSAPAESATCYGRRYPDLTYHFCEDGCDVRMLHKHFRDLGRAEGRSFGCEAPPLTEKEWNAFEAAIARETSGYAGQGFWNSRDYECGDTQLRLARAVRGGKRTRTATGKRKPDASAFSTRTATSRRTSPITSAPRGGGRSTAPGRCCGTSSAGLIPSLYTPTV